MNSAIASADEPRRQRVRALAPDERRTALIEATVPLLREHGMSVSTRQIADAAGVAEGTIFGVFPDKRSLIRAAMLVALAPEPVVSALGQIVRVPGEDVRWRQSDLRRRLVAVANVLTWHLADNAQLFAIIRQPDFTTEALASRQSVLEAVVRVIEPDRDLLRSAPLVTGQILVSLVFANHFANRRAFGIDEPMEPAEVVSVLLDGLLVRSQPLGETLC